MWLVIAWREANHKDAATNRFTDRQEALLALGMLIVVHCPEERIAENSFRLLERNAVFA